MNLSTGVRLASAAATALLSGVVGPLSLSAESADPLVAGFSQPPNAAQPRVWWHWMNGNITQEGIRLDLEWMKRIGIGGFQNFDASLGTPQVVDQRLIFMTAPWKDAFAYTTKKADELGLEMAIAGSPGWSETGGPWVAAADGMKKAVWSETEVTGGKRYRGRLPKPPSITGPFQHKSATFMFNGSDFKAPPEFYADSAVIAYRMPTSSLQAMQRPQLTVSAGTADLKALDDINAGGVIAVPVAGNGGASWIQYAFAKPQPIYGVTLGLQHTGLPVLLGGFATIATLQQSDDGVHFKDLAQVPTERDGIGQDPGQNTLSLPRVSARYFRIALSTPSTGGGIPGIDTSALGLPPASPRTEYRITRFVLHTAAAVNRFEDKAAFGVAPDLYATPTDDAPAEAVIAAKDVIDLTAQMDTDGALNCSLPPGRWMILRFGYSLTGARNSPASPEATGLEVDKLDRTAVHNYLENYLSQYASASGGLMGAHGLGFMVTDSWEAGAQNWTKDMFEDFKRLRGYDLHPWLPVLTGRVIGSAGESDRLLWDFRATLADLVAENHYGELAQTTRSHGLGLYSESHESGRAFIGDGMRVKRYATVPMSAMWTQTPGVDKEQYGYNADIRESASVAHIYGQNLVAAESLTAGSGAWAWAPEYLKPTADKEMAMGLNRFVIHTSVHQPLLGKAPGLSLGPFGQWFTRNETWAERATPWISYLARSSFLLQQGRFVADVAYFYGEDSNVTALFAVKAPPVPEGYNFDFLNADALLNSLSMNEDALTAESGMRYRVLALDDNARHMSLPVLKRLAQLVQEGATVVGERPLASPSLADDSRQFSDLSLKVWGEANGLHTYGKGRVYSGQSLESALLALKIPADFSFSRPQSDTALLFVHRSLGDAEVYFIDSRNDRRQQVDLSFRIAGKAAELWHADTGRRELASYHSAAGRTVVPVTLDPYEAVFVVFRQPAQADGLKLPASQETTLRVLDDNWQLSFQEQRGAPQGLMTVRPLQSWSDSATPGIKYFSGTGTYTTKLQVRKEELAGQARLWLDLGVVKNIAQVQVNGTDLGILWKAPFKVDATAALRAGDNEIKVQITNLWVNRLIGDQQAGSSEKFTFTTQAFYKADSPLLPSGLLGPVRLLKSSP